MCRLHDPGRFGAQERQSLIRPKPPGEASFRDPLNAKASPEQPLGTLDPLAWVLPSFLNRFQRTPFLAQ